MCVGRRSTPFLMSYGREKISQLRVYKISDLPDRRKKAEMEDQKNLIPPSPAANEAPPVMPPVFTAGPALRIVNSQPYLTQGYHVNRNVAQYPSDNYFTISIILAYFWCIFGSCGLCCIIPAIVLAAKAREAEMRGDMVEMQSKRTNALALDIIGSFVGFVTFGLFIAYFFINYQSV